MNYRNSLCTCLFPLFLFNTCMFQSHLFSSTAFHLRIHFTNLPTCAPTVRRPMYSATQAYLPCRQGHLVVFFYTVGYLDFISSLALLSSLVSTSLSYLSSGLYKLSGSRTHWSSVLPTCATPRSSFLSILTNKIDTVSCKGRRNVMRTCYMRLRIQISSIKVG